MQMAFWGVEVKPGRPFIHTYVSESAPLRLTQATLGIGTAIERSVLQCNVGDKAPVLLCSLLPNRIESTCLDLEFEEKGAVVFSVIGPRSVHLAGYFLRHSSRHGGNASGSESYGEDIWESGSNKSGSYHSSEDKYESDFIDDGDIKISSTPQGDSGALVNDVIEEENPVNENRARRRLRKKHQISDSDEEAVDPQIDSRKKSPVSESEEEDAFPISFSMHNRDREKKIDKAVKVDSKVSDVDKKREPDIVVKNDDLDREDEIVTVSSRKTKKNKNKVKSDKPLETDTAILVEDIRDKPCKDQNNYAYNTGDKSELCEGQNEKVNQDHAQELALAENSGKSRKKKKGKLRQGETETSGDLLVDKYEEGACREKIDTIGNIVQANIGDDDIVVKSGGLGMHDEKEALSSPDKLKRKKKKTRGKTCVEENAPSEILQKDDNDKSQMMEVVKHKASRSRRKRDGDQTVSEQLPKTTDVIEEPSLDVLNGKNKKKQKKNR